MKLNLRQLQRHLDTKLASIYLVSGDEALLVADAMDAIRQRARGDGFEQRERFIVDKGFRWPDLENAAENLSLFATRRVIELRLGALRLGDAGGRVLRALAERADPDRLVLIAAGKLDSAASRSSWVKAIEASGVVLQIWPVERAALPAWIGERARSLSVRLTPAAAAALADRVEGNLLAADQELRKLSLTGADALLDEDAVLAAVAESARFDVFGLVDAVLAAEVARAFSILTSLRGEGAAPVLISWALSRELILLARLHAALRQGGSLEDALAHNGVWRRRHGLIKTALRRFDAGALRHLLRRAAALDRVVKGVTPGNAWHELTQFVMLAVAPSHRSRGAA